MKPPIFDENWSPEVLNVYEHDLREIWDPSLAPHIWHMYHNQLETYLALVKHDNNLEILDVGCAQATLALLLAEKGHRVTALDIRQEFLDYAKSRYTHGDVSFAAGNVLELDYQECFDIVFANQIVEHLVYPERMLLAIKKALRTGGWVVLTTPNGAYLRNSLPGYTELDDPADWEHKQFSADGDGHFFAYSGGELSTVVTRCGFRGVSVRFFETPWISGHMKFMHLQRWLPISLCKELDAWTLQCPPLARRFGHQLMVTGFKP